MITKATITIIDDKKRRAVMRFYLDSVDWYNVTDYSKDPRAFLNEFLLRLELLIDGKIESVTLSQNIDLPHELKQVASTTADVEEIACMSTRTESGGVYHWNIPTAKESLFLADGTLDRNNTAVAEFYQWLNLHDEILPEITVNPVNSRGEWIAGDYISGYEKFKAR